MPRKHTIKIYAASHYYHIFNRGTNKQHIFLDKEDYNYFLKIIKECLSPLSNENQPYPKKITDPVAKEIDLLAYCLMPNHFHFLLKQHTENGITTFMRKLMTKYVMYFNQRHKRTGGLLEGRYKAVLVATDEQLICLTRYIHLNPKSNPLSYPYSSLSNYLKNVFPNWLKPGILEKDFDKNFYLRKKSLDITGIKSLLIDRD